MAMVVEVAGTKLPLLKRIVMLFATLCDRLVKVTMPLRAVKMVVPCSAGSGALQGTTILTALNGIVTFTNLSHKVANNITILFSSGSLVPATSTTIAISPAAVSQLVFTTQPGNATAGAAFGTQPLVKTQDQFGNLSTAGLPTSLNVSVVLSSGTGTLQGTASLDIGAAAGNGVVAFSNLRLDAAGNNKQLTARASGLSTGTSGFFHGSPGGPPG